MPSNIFGNFFCLMSFGESHGPALGVVIDGCPAGVPFNKEILSDFLKRRRPGYSTLTSQRKEPDDFQILSGVFENKTLGTPIAVVVFNKDQRSQDYEEIQKTPRTGHADEVWRTKFVHTDYRGGGRASGRETLSRVIGGSFAKMMVSDLYPKTQVTATIKQVGPIVCSRENPKMKEIKELLEEAISKGESYGGSIEVSIKNPPKSLGEPVFNKLKSQLSAAIMSIPATKGIDFGPSLTSLKGTEFHESKTSKNYAGILGGISTGKEICFTVSFKPTSSLLDTAKKGRHDPCIILRVLPVVESMSFLVLADQILAKRLNNI